MAHGAGDRNEAIKAAALLRDTIVASVGSTVGEPVLVSDLAERTCIMALKPTINQLDNAVRNLHRDGLLQRVRVFRKDNPAARYGYVLPGKDVQPTAKAPRAQGAGLPEVRVDVVRATGRLRIEFHGMSIEIGVIE